MKNRILLIALAIVSTFTARAFVTDTLTFTSARIAEPMKVAVVTPDAAKAGSDVPVVYLLNGYGGDYKQWHAVRPDLGELADKYGIFIVTPSGQETWYWDSPLEGGPQMETFITAELVPALRKAYPAMTSDPALSAITGLSMGGHGGLWLGTRHPELWGNIGSTSGGVNIMPFPTKWKMAKALGPQKGNEAVWKAHSVTSLVPRMKENGQNIIFDCGTEDFFFTENAKLHQALLYAKVPHDYISRPGNHSRAYWSNSILHQLLYFHEKFTRSASK